MLKCRLVRELGNESKGGRFDKAMRTSNPDNFLSIDIFADVQSNVDTLENGSTDGSSFQK